MGFSTVPAGKDRERKLQQVTTTNSLTLQASNTSRSVNVFKKTK
jgi:hypothetical protein